MKQTELIEQREQYLEELLAQEIIKYATNPESYSAESLQFEPARSIELIYETTQSSSGLLSIFSASSEASAKASRDMKKLLVKPFDKERLKQAQDRIHFRQQFSAFVTKNPGVFADDTYFLVSMEKNSDPNQDELFMYPGAGSTYREDAKIPIEFTDENNRLHMHPDLDIQIRRKAHRVFHEGILKKKISLLQTILPHPFVDNYPSKGGGAVLSVNVLYSNYKSGVLNGKWNVPGVQKPLGYGDLPIADRERFNIALARTTDMKVIAPDESSPTPSDQDDDDSRGFGWPFTPF